MRFRAAGLLTCILLASGCGKKGPLYYPEQLVAQPPQQVVVEQVDAALRLSFTLPDKDLAGRSLNDLAAVRISRRLCHDPGCIGCSEPYQLMQRIDLVYPAPAERRGSRISWLDNDVRMHERFQYRLQPEHNGGIIGQYLDTAPAVLSEEAPVPSIMVRPVFGGIIEIEAGCTVPQGAVFVSYIIYRADGDTEQLHELTRLFAIPAVYQDQNVKQGIVYRYAVRLVIKRADGMLVESRPSIERKAQITDDP